jgi:hypothetical protein
MKHQIQSIVANLVELYRELFVYQQVSPTWFDLKPVRYIRPNVVRRNLTLEERP